MSIKSFVLGIGLSLLIALIIVYACGFLPVFAGTEPFGYASILLFLPIAVLSFFFSKKLISHSNPKVYTGYTLVFITLKMFFTLTMIIIIKQFFEPHTVYFVIPVLLSYAVFTVYECYFLIKIGK